MANESDLKHATPQTQLSLADQKTQKEIEKLDAEIAKIGSEKAKINADVKAGRERFYRTPVFYSAISPIVLACLGLVFTWSSGWFDVQKQKIENEKTLLTIETKSLEKQRSQLTDDTKTLEVKKNQQIAEIEKYKSEFQRLQNEYTDLEIRLNTLQRTDALFNDLKVSLKPVRYGSVTGWDYIKSQGEMERVLQINQSIAQVALDYVRTKFSAATNHNLLAWHILSDEWPDMYQVVHEVSFGENANKKFRDGDCVKYYLGLTNVMYQEQVPAGRP